MKIGRKLACIPLVTLAIAARGLGCTTTVEPIDGAPSSMGSSSGSSGASSSGSSSGGSGASSSGSSSGGSNSGGSSGMVTDSGNDAGDGGGGASSSGSPEAGNRVPRNHRASDAQCQTQPAVGDCAGNTADAGLVCAMDSQCTSGDNGRCVLGGGAFAHACSCTYDACSHDTDCSAGQACACHGSPYTGDSDNTCVPGNCRVDADCGQGGYCSPSSTTVACGGFSVAGYYCHTSADTCVDDADCTLSSCGTSPGAPTCLYSSSAGHWACACVPGCV